MSRLAGFAYCLLPLFAASQGAEAEAPWQPLFDGRESPVASAPRLFGPARQQVLVAAGVADRERAVIAGLANGAFSAPGRSERAYSVQLPPEAGPSPKSLLVILSDTRETALAQTELDGAQTVLAAVDTNGDGRDELLLRADLYQMGHALTQLSLAQLESGRLNIIRRFEDVIDNACDDPRFGGQVRASRVEFRAGPTPAFRQTDYEAACGETEPPPPTSFRPAKEG